MFSFFQRFRTPARAGTPLSFSTYDAFTHRFTDTPTRFRLACLKIGDCDWGHHARFTAPVTSADGTRIFMWEIKWVPALHEERDFPGTGWHRREVMVDLAARTFTASTWDTIRAAPTKPAPRWRLSGRARAITAFHSPIIARGNPIGRVTDEVIEIVEYGERRTFHWRELQLIHFSRNASNCCETPVNEATLDGGGYATVSLPNDLAHPFYGQLIRRGCVDRPALERFFARDEDSELTVLSARGDLVLRDMDEEQAIAALWAARPDVPTDLGGLLVKALSPHRERGFEAFPARRYHFEFSSINGKGNRALWRDEIARWRKALRPGWRVTWREQGSPMLELHGARLSLTLDYHRSAGTGWLSIDPWLYRHKLLQEARWQTDFAPARSCVIPNARVSSHYGLSARGPLPAPDALHRRQLTLWRADDGRCGITADGWLYLWRGREATSIVDEVEDEYADRGGPYYTIHIAFGDTAALRLTRGNGSAAQLIEFFQ